MTINYYNFLNLHLAVDCPKVLNELTLRQHIPGIKALSFVPSTIDITIRFVQSELSCIKYDNCNLLIYSNCYESIRLDIPHLLYSYLKYVCFEKHIYFIHSAIINNTLFIGASGSGKTLLTQYSISKGCHISGVDRTLVNINSELDILAATDILSVRTTVEQPSLSLLDSTPDRFLYALNGLLTKSVHIDKLVLFRINNSKLVTHTITGLSKTHNLYPWFIDNIKTDCFIDEGNILFTPQYTDSDKKYLFQQLTTLSIPLYYVEGTMDDILNWTSNV